LCARKATSHAHVCVRAYSTCRAVPVSDLASFCERVCVSVVCCVFVCVCVCGWVGVCVCARRRCAVAWRELPYGRITLRRQRVTVILLNGSCVRHVRMESRRGWARRRLSDMCLWQP